MRGYSFSVEGFGNCNHNKLFHGWHIRFRRKNNLFKQMVKDLVRKVHK